MPVDESLLVTTITPTLRAVNVRLSERARYFSSQDILKLVSRELAKAKER